MPSYATLAQIEARLGVPSGTDDVLLQLALDEATAFIESYCHRSFQASTETRLYDDTAVDGQTLYLDGDLLTVTTLTNGDATVIPSSAYWLEPTNTLPRHAIRLKISTYWYVYLDQRVSVAGTWGYSATPDALIQLCCLRLAEFAYRSKSPLSVTTVFDPTLQKERPEGFPLDVLTALDTRMRLSL